MGRFSFTVRFCGITAQFRLPSPIQLPDHFAGIACEDVAEPDDVYTVELLTSPLCISSPKVASIWQADIYHTEQGWLYIYPALGDGNGCQVACLFCSEGHHTLYYPASRWEEFSRNWWCTHMICGERLLLRHDALLLHSSFVLHQGKAVLFCGPSGAGKSTQAQLWQEHLGAQIINGDRTVLRRTQEGFLAGGSMWSGTSHIVRPEQAPVGAIFLVEHGETEQLQRLHFEAFKPLLTQTIVNSWDPAFMEGILGLLSDLIDQIPIYRLSCRPCKEAVLLASQTL